VEVVAEEEAVVAEEDMPHSLAVVAALAAEPTPLMEAIEEAMAGMVAMAAVMDMAATAAVTVMEAMAAVLDMAAMEVGDMAAGVATAAGVGAADTGPGGTRITTRTTAMADTTALAVLPMMPRFPRHTSTRQ